VADAHVLGTTILNGRQVMAYLVLRPEHPAWFTLAIDCKTFRTLDSRMTATAHFMHDAYRSCNATPAIRPPIHP